MAKTTKRRVKRKVSEAKVFVQATFNNTIVTITEMNGDALAWSSSGSLGFKGAKKSTPYVAQRVVETAFDKVKDFGLQTINIYVKGPGMGRESAIRTIGHYGLVVRSISDITPIPHNGCRPRKTRNP